MGTGVLLFTLTGALTGALLPAAPVTAQGAGLPPNLQRIQDAAVAAERRATFFELWEAADEVRQERAASALAELRPDGRRLDGWPTTAELSLAIRVLRGGELDELRADPLIAFADAIGLLAVPGVADVEPERGEPITVRVHLTKRAVLEGAVELALYWRAPDGSEERARREPFPAAAFLRGFPMYIRAPNEAGSWQLVPKVTFEERTVPGFGVPVQATVDLAERLEADRNPTFEERLELLRDHGVRTADGAGIEGWLSNDLAENGGVALPRATLLVATSRDEAPDAFRYGRIAKRWRTLARELGLELAVRPAGEVQRWLSPQRQPVYIVARGDAVADLHLALLGRETKGVAGLILSTTMDEPGPALPAVPTLIIGPGTGTGGPTPFLTEPELPALVRPWLEEQLE